MHGLVLEGGGAKGAFQMGAWEAFRALGMTFDAVSGTSVGALNGALYVQGDYHKAFDMWYNLKPEHVINGDAKVIEKLSSLDLGLEDMEALIRYASSVFSSGGLDISPLKALIATMVDEKKIRRSPMAFGIVTVSLTDFKPQEIFLDAIPSGQLGAYLLASANLPIFKMNRINGKLYIDGGFYDNLPINLLASKGVRKIVAVELLSAGVRQPVKVDGLDICWITPSENIGRLLEFNPDKIHRNMRLGYYDTMRAFKHFMGTTYYIEGVCPRDWGLEQLLAIPAEALTPVMDWMGAEGMEPRRFLFEMLIPLLATLLDVGPLEGYNALLLKYYEAIAGIYGVERLHIYGFSAFVDLVNHRQKDRLTLPPASIVEVVAKRLRQNPLYLKAHRDEVLLWVFKLLQNDFRAIS